MMMKQDSHVEALGIIVMLKDDKEAAVTPEFDSADTSGLIVK